MRIQHAHEGAPAKRLAQASIPIATASKAQRALPPRAITAVLELPLASFLLSSGACVIGPGPQSLARERRESKSRSRSSKRRLKARPQHGAHAAPDDCTIAVCVNSVPER